MTNLVPGDDTVTTVPWKVRFFTQPEEALLLKCVAQIPNTREMIVQPLARVGFSGAKVFTLFPSGQHSLPYVVKMHHKYGIQRELDGRDRANSFFREAQQRSYVAESDSGVDLSVMATPLYTNEKDGVTELTDILFATRIGKNCGDDPAVYFQQSDKVVLDALTDVYKVNCNKSFSAVTYVSRNLGEEYEKYLRHNKTAKLLKAWLGRNVSSRRVEMFGSSLPNPWLLIQDLLKLERRLPVSTVHGDLHPSNVVLNNYRQPNLIDFTWCQSEKHILKDFLVMECSIRFLMLPRHLSKAMQRTFDTCMLNPTPERVEKMLARIRPGVPTEAYFHLERCAKIVIHLRECARAACNEQYAEGDYLACQALVLYGLMMIGRYPFGTCAQALGLIGKELLRLDYV